MPRRVGPDDAQDAWSETYADIGALLSSNEAAACRSAADGSTESYAAVARATGNPAAVRAVGSACSHNPVPVVVPCHRMVRSDGAIGQYLGGTEIKAVLVAREAAS